MNLWDLEIEKIPCGWEEEYQNALQEHPNGTVIECDEGCNEVSKYYYHPVQCHDLLIRNFNKAKIDAKSLLAERNNLELGDFINGIVRIDALLLYIIDTWVTDMMDCSCFNPEKIMPQSDKDIFETYFTSNEFEKLRLVK
jgi:hypothetical protein